MKVELSNIVFSYGRDAPAGLDGLNLNVEEGQFVALLGPSGCGKTTTLKLLVGLLRPQAGAIRIAGKDVTSLGPEQRNVSMVFQNYALFPHLTVEQNVGFGLRMKRVAQDRPGRRSVDQILALMGLTELRHKLPKQLSGGQQQRVGVARAVVTEPDVLLMDEPLSNLDSRLRERMCEEISRIQKELRLSVVYVTHDRYEAMAMADRVVVMEAGKIVDSAEPRQLYAHPQNLASALSLGDANAFTGAQMDRWLREADRGDGSDGSAVRFIVRPEHFVLRMAPGPDLAESHRCRVVAAAYRGDRMRLHLRVDEIDKDLIVQIDDETLFGAIGVGSVVYLGVGLKHVVTIGTAATGR